jgi:hypothetical protein
MINLILTLCGGSFSCNSKNVTQLCHAMKQLQSGHSQQQTVLLESESNGVTKREIRPVKHRNRNE